MRRVAIIVESIASSRLPFSPDLEKARLGALPNHDAI